MKEHSRLATRAFRRGVQLAAATLAIAGLGAVSGCLDSPDRSRSRRSRPRPSSSGSPRAASTRSISSSSSTTPRRWPTSRQILALAVPDLVNGLVNPACLDNTRWRRAPGGDAARFPPGNCPSGSTREFPPIVRHPHRPAQLQPRHLRRRRLPGDRAAELHRHGVDPLQRRPRPPRHPHRPLRHRPASRPTRTRASSPGTRRRSDMPPGEIEHRRSDHDDARSRHVAHQPRRRRRPARLRLRVAERGVVPLPHRSDAVREHLAQQLEPGRDKRHRPGPPQPAQGVPPAGLAPRHHPGDRRDRHVHQGVQLLPAVRRSLRFHLPARPPGLHHRRARPIPAAPRAARPRPRAAPPTRCARRAPTTPAADENTSLRAFGLISHKAALRHRVLLPAEPLRHGAHLPRPWPTTSTCRCRNPIYSILDPANDSSAVRDPSLVFYAAIVGVPWQLIARQTTNGVPDLINGVSALDPTQVGGFKTVRRARPDGHRPATPFWDDIAGDPENYVLAALALHGGVHRPRAAAPIPSPARRSRPPPRRTAAARRSADPRSTITSGTSRRLPATSSTRACSPS